MNKYAALLEDEDDIFGGTPKSKFWDMLTTPDRDVPAEVIDEIVTRYACMEHIIKQSIGEEVINSYLQNYYHDNEDQIENVKKSLYMEFAGNIISKMSQ